MLLLSRNKLKACLYAAAKGDLRQYLNGVHIELAAEGDLHYVATDGRRLFAGRVPGDKVACVPKMNGLSLIIPRDTVEKAVKGRSPVDVIELSALPDGRYTLGEHVFCGLPGKFPDWRRILPQTAGKEEAVAQFNHEYVSDGQKALALWRGRKNDPAYLRMYGEDTAYMACSDAVYLVMPLTKRGYEPVASVPTFAPVYTTPAPEVTDPTWAQAVV